MKGIMRSVDRFCVKHPRFGIPNLMIFIVIGNAIVFFFSMMDTSGLLGNMLCFDAQMIFTRGQIWRLVTFALIPSSSNILFLAISLYFYYFIGSTLEREWGTPKFTLYYISGMVFTIIFGTILWLVTGRSYAVNASYINLSMFFSFAVLYPDMRVLLFFIIPIKIKWLAIVDGVFFLWAVLTTSFPVNLLPVVAILNFLLFCGEDLLGYIKPIKARNSPKAVNFRKAAKKYKREMKDAPYSRKCSVCGRTDADYPNLNFRYCSRCQGYHCFCEEHINSHVHFTE